MRIPTRSPTKLPTRLPTRCPTKLPTRLPTRRSTKLPTRTSWSLSLARACLALLATGIATAGDGPATGAELQSALRAVLEHGDLADVPFLNDTLGLGLRVTKPDPRSPYSDPENHFRAIGTRVPPALLATSLAYFAEYTPAYNRSRISLDFVPRNCPRLVEWGKAWNLTAERSFDPHGAGDSEGLKLPGDHPIELGIFHHYTGTCSLSLIQLTNQPVHLTPPAAVNAQSGGALATQLATVFSLGDLRDYAKVGRALDTELVPSPRSTQDGLLNKGSIDFAVVIPGVDPWRSDYYGDDTGWISPPSFTFQPRRLAPREAHLNLYLDPETTCLSLADLDASVRRAVPRVATERTDAKRVIYTATGDNEIQFGAWAEDGCIQGVSFNQITAIASNVKMPVMFPLPASLNARSGKLSAPTLKTIDAIMARANSKPTPLSEVQVITCQAEANTPTPSRPASSATALKPSTTAASTPPTTATPTLQPPTTADIAAASQLADRVKDAFIARGIPVEKINRVSGDDSRAIDCSGRVIGERDGSGPTFVVVTVAIDGK